jgi:mannan endo-1,4-beta-mannosidase
MEVRPSAGEPDPEGKDGSLMLKRINSFLWIPFLVSCSAQSTAVRETAAEDFTAAASVRPTETPSAEIPSPTAAGTPENGAAPGEWDVSPSDEHALPEAKALLAYLAELSSPDDGRAIVGQNCYHGDEITESEPQNGYENLVVELFRRSGKWVGLVGVDYEYMKMYSPGELSGADRILIDHWNKGGLVTVNFSPLNPWTLPESGPVKVPEVWDGPGSPMDLVDPAQPVSAEWRKKLDRMAAALSELRDAGVIVLWRPMQEMNGFWFWWGDDPEGYRAVYADMFDYFTREKGLNNLLWVYSPSGEIPDVRTYPGDSMVDVVAPTEYNDRLDVKNYELFSALGAPRKPFALGEYGPKLDGPLAKVGGLDTREFINRIREDYPRTAYFVAWHSYPESRWSIVGNRNYVELMNDPDVLTVDKMDWRTR